MDLAADFPRLGSAALAAWLSGSRALELSDSRTHGHSDQALAEGWTGEGQVQVVKAGEDSRSKPVPLFDRLTFRHDESGPDNPQLFFDEKASTRCGQESESLFCEKSRVALRPDRPGHGQRTNGTNGRTRRCLVMTHLGQSVVSGVVSRQ